MNSKEILTQYNAGTVFVEQLAEEQIYLQGLMNKYPQITAKAIKCYNSMSRQIEETKKKQSDIIKAINSIDNEILRTLLFEVYVNKRTLLYLANELKYSYSHIKRLHRKALEAFENVYPHNYT